MQARRVDLVIRHEHNKWCLYTHDGSKKIACHPTREAALRQERAIQVYKHASAALMAVPRVIGKPYKRVDLLYTPHPLTPEERSRATKKAWESRQHGQTPQPIPKIPEEQRQAALDALHDVGVEAALALLPPVVGQTMQAMLSRAPAANDELRANLIREFGQTGTLATTEAQLASGPGITYGMGPIKGAARMLQKTLKDYDGDPTEVKDVVRATVAASTHQELEQVVKTIREKFELARDPKDRFATPAQGCYKDYLFNVQLSDGTVGEIQVHYKPLLREKNRIGHRIYEKMGELLSSRRTPRIDAAIGALVAASCKLYNAVA